MQSKISIKRILIFFSFFVTSTLIILIGIKLFSNSKSVENNIEYINYKDLKIVSQYEDYVLAVDKQYSETQTYAIYKNVEYDDFVKIFPLKYSGFTLEDRYIYWDDNKIYFFCTETAEIYDLSNGNLLKSLSMYKIHNNQVGSFVRVLGADKENIYYEYLHNSEYYYACVDFELKDVKSVTREEIDSLQLRKGKTA